ncbi:hypothetical protein JHK85_004734 [Glycine max]|nr:hypothetical protein JHK85_004734 [Glycine max]
MLCASTNSDTICLVIIQDPTRYAIHYGKPSSRLINVQMRCMEVHIQPNHHDDLLGYFSLDQEAEIPIEALVGLKEFDGHEGLHSEFNGDDVFMLEESLLITHRSKCVVSKKDEY